MFCKYCGSELSADTNFCVKCGKLHDGVHPEDEGAVVVQPIVFGEDAESWESDALAKQAYGKSILLHAILGMSFGVTGFLSVVGLVFASISRWKLSKYRERFGQPEGKAMVGKHLSLVALIVGVVALIILIAAFSGSIGSWLTALFS